MKRCLYFFLGLVAALLLAVLSGGNASGGSGTFKGAETASVRADETNLQMPDATGMKSDKMNLNQESP